MQGHVRVLHYLGVMTPPNEKIFHLEQPLKEIANDIGISPEVLSRTSPECSILNKTEKTRYECKDCSLKPLICR
jgi:hypothetical protein